jgi:hypothetical protein
LVDISILNGIINQLIILGGAPPCSINEWRVANKQILRQANVKHRPESLV